MAVYGVFMPQLHISDNFTLIDKQQSGFGIRLEFANQRVIDLRSRQVIQHVHRGGEQYALIGLASLPTKDLGQKGFAEAWISDQHDIGAVPKERKIEQPQNAVLGLDTAFVMGKVK